MRICSRCIINKNLGSFNSNQMYCRECQRQYNYEQKLLKLNKYRKRKNDWAKANPIARHRQQTKTKYGLSHDNYNKMMSAQNNKCAICLNSEASVKRKGCLSKPRMLSVDHCHTTGRVRSFLCGGCNKALGLIKENFDTAIRLAKYIQLHNNVN